MLTAIYRGESLFFCFFGIHQFDTPAPQDKDERVLKMIFCGSAQAESLSDLARGGTPGKALRGSRMQVDAADAVAAMRRGTAKEKRIRGHGGKRCHGALVLSLWLHTILSMVCGTRLIGTPVVKEEKEKVIPRGKLRLKSVATMSGFGIGDGRLAAIDAW